MKKIITVLLFGLAFAAGQAQNMPGMKMDKQKETGKKPAATYTCPMHPEIHSATPGNCPKCGMKLVKKKTAKPQAEEMPDSSKKDGADMPMQHMHDKDTSHSMKDMGNMPMNGMQHMPMKNMGSANLLDKIAMAKQNLGTIKTIASTAPPRLVHYDLYVTDTVVTFGKKKKRAIAVNGQIPMPTLTFTEGDTAEIVVHNNLDEETALHWHGLLLPNRYDGVPNLTQMPIPPHSVFTYRFPIIQHGTHWYHSHSGLQEQIGMYGSMVLNKRAEWDIPTIPVVISEWADMKPKEIERSLHAASDWFSIRKGSTQSYAEAIKKGWFKTKVANEWKRMNAMDLTDIYYDNFLLNGKNQSEQPQFKKGDKVRLRIANGGASDYFWLSYAGGKITVAASDGNDMEPVEVDRLIVGTSETYDVVVTVPDNKSYEFLVTPEDRTKHASLWLGSGEKVAATKMQRPKYFAGMQMMNGMMDMNGNMIEMPGMRMQNQVMDMNTVMYPEITGPEKKTNATASGDTMMQSMTGMGNMNGMQMPGKNSLVTLNYDMLRAPEKTTLPGTQWKEMTFELTGNMNRYVWSMDNKVLSETDQILIKKGENVRIILYNNSMMRHPMHLHGHDFRILNGQGEYAPLKNVLDIMPMERDTIEFAAKEAGGDWFFHCHILYHMMSGMARVFRYDNNLPNPEIPDPALAQRKLYADDRMFHLMGTAGLESNGSDGQFMYGNTRWRASTLWHLGFMDMHGYESETMIGRYMGRMQWWMPYVGFDYHYKKEGGPKNLFGSEDKNLFGQTSNKLSRRTVVAGVAYTLPMLFVADMRIDGNAKLRFQLSREDIPLTNRLRFNLMMNTDKEYMAGFRYIVTKYISLSTHYDSDMGMGAGLTFTY